MINYEQPDGGDGGGGGSAAGNGVSVRTRKSGDGLETTSELTLRNAAPGDSGNYTCQPSNAGSASIHVFVSEGDCSSSSAVQLSSTYSSFLFCCRDMQSLAIEEQPKVSAFVTTLSRRQQEATFKLRFQKYWSFANSSSSFVKSQNHSTGLG